MAIDLTGGMDASKDEFFAKRPDDPDFRESASFWVSDDKGEIGLPRIGIEAVASEWDQRGLQLNLGFADGRALIVRGLGARAGHRSTTTACAARSRPARWCSVTSSRSTR
jgi:hypothetical protein